MSFVHSVMEAAADKRLGKRTFAHLLGGKTSQITVSEHLEYDNGKTHQGREAKE